MIELIFYRSAVILPLAYVLISLNLQFNIYLLNYIFNMKIFILKNSEVTNINLSTFPV